MAEEPTARRRLRSRKRQDTPAPHPPDATASPEPTASPDPTAPPEPAASPAPAGRRARRGADRTERGLRGLVGAGPTQLGVTAAMRARDASRPTPADLAAAERDLVIVHRNYVAPDDTGPAQPAPPASGPDQTGSGTSPDPS